MENNDKRKYYFDLFYIVIALLLGIGGNLWVYFFSECFEASFALGHLHWAIILMISSVVLIIGLYLSLHVILRGIRGRLPRILKYKKATKVVQIHDEEGNARITWLHQGKNIGKTRTSIIRHIVKHPNYPIDEKKVSAKIGGESVPVVVNTFKVSSSQAKVPDNLIFQSDIYLDLSTKPIEAGDNFIYEVNVELKKAYKDAFGSGHDFSIYPVTVPTDELVTKVLPPLGYQIYPHFEEGSACIAKDGHTILDLAETSRINEDNPPIEKNNKLIWSVKKPFVNYVYRINFKIRKP